MSATWTSSAAVDRRPADSPRLLPAPNQASHSRVAADDLLALARRGLVEAAVADSPAERYAAAHLAALRAAAAVLAARVGPGRPVSVRGRGPRSVWDLLPAVLPALAEWSAFFAAGAGKRAAAEARLPGAITHRDADDLLRDAETFLGLITELLGRGHQPLLPGRDGG
ncbi:MAG: SAV_6107 family HEPN domain-containing protein [Frankiaceae bacterium]